MKMPNRTFGVELEIINLSEYRCERALREAGIRTGYGDGCWEIKGDYSISSPNGQSAEVVSPILSGVKGLREVRKVCRVLADAGAWVNASCGLHVHVGATKGEHQLTPDEVATLVMRYAKHEKVIDRFVHHERREDNGEFCQSMIDYANLLKDGGKGVLVKELEWVVQRKQNCTHSTYSYDVRGYVTMTPERCEACRQYANKIRDLERSISNHNGKFRSVDDITDIVCERYSKVNMQAWYDHGTIEFRHHNGALDPKTVTNWIRFVVNFVEQSRRVSAKKVRRDTSPLTGLPTHVRRFYEARQRLRSRAFDSWA